MNDTSISIVPADVPLSKLVASEKNVRRTNRVAGVEELAASIAARGLLQSPSVQPILNRHGNRAGSFRIRGHSWASRMR